jgi:hypothetical protein
MRKTQTKAAAGRGRRKKRRLEESGDGRVVLRRKKSVRAESPVSPRMISWGTGDQLPKRTFRIQKAADRDRKRREKDRAA